MKKIFLVLLFLLSAPAIAKGASFLDVAINEIAWMGTKANSSDEWIELYNNTNQSISLEGWGLYEAGGETLIEPLGGIIEANSYYLIERTDDTTISDIPASQKPSGWGGYGLNNNGEHLQLRDNSSVVIDEVNCSGGWFAGKTSLDYKTMERKDSAISGNESNNWGANNGVTVNGFDAKGNPIQGTPKTKNSIGSEPMSSPTPTPTPASPTPSPEISPEITPLSETPSPTLPPLPSPTPTPSPTPEISYPSGIIINEVLPAPIGPDETEEWIEIFNQNNFEADLSEWQIADTAGSAKTYTFPKGTKIAAQGFLVLSRPTTKITLNNDEDGLSLFQPNGNILDSVNYQKAPQGQSYNRSGSGWTWSPLLTPGSKNILTQPETKKEAEKKSENETQKVEISPERKRELATIKEQIPKSSKSLFIFLIAFGLAIFSGIIIFILKRKLKNASGIDRSI